MSTKKRYRSVTEMIRDLSDDPAFAENTTRKIRERNIINHLMGLRASLGMSQKEIAQKMDCTQSRISKLERGKDDDLRIGDFHAYADALGLQMVIVLAEKGEPPIADRIKFHTNSLKNLFQELSELSGTDGGMIKGMVNLVATSLTQICVECTKILKKAKPRRHRQGPSAPAPIRVELQKAFDEEGGEVDRLRECEARQLGCD